MSRHTFKLKSIIITSLAIAMLFTSVFQSLYIYKATSQEISGNVKELSQKFVGNFAERLNQYFQRIQSIALMIKMNRTVLGNLSMSFAEDSFSEYQANEQITSFLMELSNLNEDIVGILILSNKRAIHDYISSFGLSNIELLDNTYLKQAINSAENSGYIATFENDIIKNSSHKHVFAYYEKIYKNGECIATICFLIGENALQKLIANASEQEETIFIKSDDQIVYPYNNPDYMQINEKKLNNDSTVSFLNEDYLYTSTKLSNGWSLVNLIPIKNINNSSSAISQKLFFSFLITFAVYLLFLIIISNSISDRLNRLNKKMSTVGLMNTKIEDHFYITEIATLNTQFNQMSNRIIELMDEVKKEQIFINKTKMDLLQAQINPHFLYNTLDAINWMAMDIDAYNISEMTTNLANMFRYSLNNGNEMTLLSNELAHLHTYINIQKYRYNDRLKYSESIETELFSCRTLNIMLQPLVENSLVHGLRDIEDHISIKISVYRREEAVYMLVADDGKGCDAAFMNDYLSSPQNSTTGYGVKNIHHRIQLHFGEKYGVCYLQALTGTKVQIKIPYMEG